MLRPADFSSQPAARGLSWFFGEICLSERFATKMHGRDSGDEVQHATGASLRRECAPRRSDGLPAFAVGPRTTWDTLIALLCSSGSSLVSAAFATAAAAAAARAAGEPAGGTGKPAPRAQLELTVAPKLADEPRRPPPRRRAAPPAPPTVRWAQAGSAGRRRRARHPPSSARGRWTRSGRRSSTSAASSPSRRCTRASWRRRRCSTARSSS